MHDSASVPRSRSPAASCIAQPGLALATSPCPLARSRRPCRAQLARHLGLQHVVEARGAAAAVAVRRGRRPRSPGCCPAPHAAAPTWILRAQRVTRVVIRDTFDAGDVRRGARIPVSCEELHRVAHTSRSRRAPVVRAADRRISSRCAPHPAALTTTGRRPRRRRRTVPCAPAIARRRGVRCARGARRNTPGPRDHDAPAVARRTRIVARFTRAEPPVLHAAGEQRDRSRRCPEASVTRGSDVTSSATECEGASARCASGGAGVTSGSSAVAAASGHPRGEHTVEPEPSQDGEFGATAIGFDLRPGPLHHPAERHVGGAHVLARAAGETQVHERHERVVDDRRGPRRPRASPRSGPVERRTPRRSAGRSGSAGGTGRTRRSVAMSGSEGASPGCQSVRTLPARARGIGCLPGRSRRRAPHRGAGGADRSHVAVGHQIPPQPRPGASTPAGSNASLSRRWTAAAERDGSRARPDPGRPARCRPAP